MKTISLKDFFKIIKYNWKKDKKSIETICYYTKTRVNADKAGGDYVLGFGVEQTFLLKAISEWSKAKNFFEIGTGRGTACYALSLIPEMQTIHTIDIIPSKQKFATAIGHKPATVSLQDIRKMIPFKEKDKVHFHLRKEIPVIRPTFSDRFDLAFIDGDHTNEGVILEDYAVCMDFVKKGGLILWDDYDPERFAVKKLVDNIVKKDPLIDVILVEQRGHLFDDKPIEHGKGVVIMKHGEIII